MKGLDGKVSDLERAAAQRKAKLDENSAFLQFNWKADVVESWIGELENEAPGYLWNIRWGSKSSVHAPGIQDPFSL